MNRSSNLIRTIVDVGLFAALGFVLDEIQGIAFASVFTAGGSIGFAMVAVLIVAYRRGWLPAMLTGLIMGCLDLITKAYFITFWQVLLDYILPYALVGTAGFFKPWFDREENSNKRILILCLGAVVGGMLKFLSHFIVGMLVWAPMGYDWPIKSEALYSFAYNIAFTGPSIVLSAALLVALYKRAPQVVCMPQTKVEEVERKHIKTMDYLFNPTMIIFGLFLFAFYLVIYIQNFKIADKGWAVKLSSSQDAVFMLFTGLLLFVAFGIYLLLSFKNKHNYRLSTITLIIICISHVIYAIAKILICYFDEWVDPKLYFIWMVVAFLLAVISFIFFFLIKESEQKTEQIAQ